MNGHRWARVADVFDAALDRAPEERPRFLEQACQGDDDLRRDVERLIEADEDAGDFLASSAFRIESAEDGSRPGESADPCALEPGDRLGRYEVIALVGSGGMGEVYRARDPNLGREVGVKVLRRGEVTSEQLRRFEREARAAGALNHSNILAVYDIGMANGVPYVVSELLEGQTLRADLGGAPLPIERALDVALQIAAGLTAAHDKGIVHRDLKPENLFVTREGLVKILDFGLAKHTAPAVAGTHRGSLTEHGLVIGTLGYMAPEQILGADTDARADVFAFGALLYELLTGERAFAGGSIVDTMNAILTAQPRMPATLPAAITAVVSRCLEKDPALRFQSMRDVSAALGKWGRESWSPALPATPDLVSWRWLAAAAAFVAVIGAAVSFRADRGAPGPGASGRPAIAVLPLDDRSTDPSLAWLSDGASRMLVTALAQTPGLDVIGSERLQASFTELGRDPSDRSTHLEVARHAGAGAILVGTLFRVGNDIRLDVQVQAVDTGRIVAARTEQGADLFAVVDNMAAHVRTALDVGNRPAGRPLRDVTTTSIDAYELYIKGQRARHNNRFGDARTFFVEALRVDPAFTLARAQLVEILDRLGENAAALAEQRVVRSQLHRLPERQRLLAEAVQVTDDNPARAIELLERLLAQYPDEDEAYDSIVHAYSHTRDPAYWKKALAFMERWARAIPGPGSGHFHNHRGYAYIEHGLFTEAEREFRAYIRVSPDEANAYDSLAELFVMTGRPAQAVEHYDQALRLNPLFGWSHFGRSYALAMQGHYANAFTGLATLRELGPRASVPPAVTRMVEALLYSRVGRYRAAAADLDAARRIARQQNDHALESSIELFEATFALERGELERSIGHAGRAALLGGDSPDIMSVRRSALAHLIAAVAEIRAGRPAGARRRASLLAALNNNGDPIQTSGQQRLAGELALVDGRFDDAEASFRASEHRIDSSFSIYPVLVMLVNNAPFRDGLARATAGRGDIAGAIELYRKLNQPGATSTWPSVIEPRFVLAVARLAEKGGDAKTAAAESKRFLDLWSAADQSAPELAEARAATAPAAAP
jgi:tetratricopeptide (TPR) repeat protein/TolB-like protein